MTSRCSCQKHQAKVQAMSSQTMNDHHFSEDLSSPGRFLDKPRDLAPVPISTVISLLNPKYQSTLDAVLKFQSTPDMESPTSPKSVSFTADDIKLIATEALRISHEQSLAASDDAHGEFCGTERCA